MLIINKNEIPDYLKNSKFYENIKSIDFEISEEYYKENVIINTYNDLISYIKILNYWSVNKIPHEFYDWIFRNKNMICEDNKQMMFQDLVKNHLTNNSLIDEIIFIISSRDKIICEVAVEYGRVDCLEYALRYYSYDVNTCYIAAKNGNLDCLKYAYEYGCDWESCVCEVAALNGHLDCLKYAHENDCEWNDWTCSQAAKNGHLDCLKYAHENGCEWNSETCEWAAESGHLECLLYAVKNGCIWVKEI